MTLKGNNTLWYANRAAINGHILEKVRDSSKVTIKLITNRKWHTPFQITRISLTLFDLEGS